MMRADDDSPDDFIRMPEVERRTGLRKSEIYRRIALGEFPRGLRLGHRTAVWVVRDINNWKQQWRATNLL